MIIPRFTVRRLLAITAVVAVFFAIVSAAVRGASQNPGVGYEERAVNPAFAAAAVAIGVGSLAATALVFAGFFLAAWLASEMTGLSKPSSQPKSPFAQHTPAPQLLPPDEPA